MRGQPDWTFTVQVWADRSLTERGWDVLADALDAADLPTVLEQAALDAIHAALPRQPDDRPWADWYALVVAEEVAFGATICPDPAHHLTPPIKSAVAGATPRSHWHPEGITTGCPHCFPASP